MRGARPARRLRRAGRRVDNDEAYGAWCRGIARRVVMHDQRSESRRSARLSQIAASLYGDRFMASDPNPERRCELREELRSSLGHLDGPARELIFRRYLLEETSGEVAERLHRSPASVRMRVMRLRTILREGSER